MIQSGKSMHPAICAARMIAVSFFTLDLFENPLKDIALKRS